MFGGVIAAAAAVLVAGAAAPGGAAPRVGSPGAAPLPASHRSGRAPVLVAALPSLPAEAGGAAMSLSAAALPPPPQQVVRETRTYGTVTLDHAAHLARRVACRDCHGAGRVQKIVFTPRYAHDACRGCHIKLAKGPTACRGCHAIPPKPVMVASASEPDAGAAQSVEAVAPLPAPAAAAPAAAVPPRPSGVAFARTIETGFLTLVGQRQELVIGPSLQLVARSGANAISFTIVTSGGTGDGRTQFLVGGGRSFPLGPTVRATAQALGGLDATHSPSSALPALGLRGALEWQSTGPWTLGASVTALADLMRGDKLGEPTGGTTVGFVVFAGKALALR